MACCPPPLCVGAGVCNVGSLLLALVMMLAFMYSWFRVIILAATGWGVSKLALCEKGHLI